MSELSAGERLIVGCGAWTLVMGALALATVVLVVTNWS